MNYFESGSGGYNDHAVKSYHRSAIKEDNDIFFNADVIPPVSKLTNENNGPVCFSTGDVAVISVLIIVIALSCALLVYICKRFWGLKRRQKRNSSFTANFSKPRPNAPRCMRASPQVHFEREGATRRSMYSQFHERGTTFSSPDLPQQRHERFISSGYPAFPGARNVPSSSRRYGTEPRSVPCSSSRRRTVVDQRNVPRPSSDDSGDYSCIPRYSKIVTKAQIH